MGKTTYRAIVVEGTNDRTFQILENGKPMHWMEVIGDLEVLDQFTEETRKRWRREDEELEKTAEKESEEG